MFRLLFVSVVLVLGSCLFTAEAGGKKKPADLSVFSGRITDVNLSETTKKVQSIYVEVRPNQKRNANIDEKTKIEFVGFADKEAEKLTVGQMADVKMDLDANVALTIKVTAGTVRKKKN